MREEGKVRAAGCLRLELVGDAAASVMDVAEAELAAAGAALADLAFVAVQVRRARLARRSSPMPALHPSARAPTARLRMRMSFMIF